MRCCKIIRNLVTGVIPSTPVEPPVLSDYCVQWGFYDYNVFFPCGDNNSVNGVFDSGAICGGTLDIADFVQAGNSFRYFAAGGANNYYIQVITPAANGQVADFGYIEYDIFGNPSGPVPIGAIQESNCFVNCYSSTFDVEDVSVDGFSMVTLQTVTRSIDLDGPGGVPTPFDDPAAEADYLTNLQGRAGLEPTATVSITINSPTNVTLTICTIIPLTGGSYGDVGGDKGQFTFS